MSHLCIQKISRHFDTVHAVSDCSLNVAEGGLHALLGPSGCGKTTMLRLIAGFDRPDEGQISLAGEMISNLSSVLPPEKRQIGMVFQDYHLFPHLNVWKNVAFGLRNREEKPGRVGEVLELVGLTHVAKAMPHELSGGQQQRVAMARALAPKPRLLLMDEPFSNLDAKLRVRLRGEVRTILRDAGITTLLVTHDQEEALSVADEVSVMVDGKVVQSSSPKVLYFRPATEFVADFVGEANFLPGNAKGRVVSCSLGALVIDQELAGPVRVLLRPESLQLTHSLKGQNGGASGVVMGTQFFGHDQLLQLRLEGGEEVISRVGPEWQSSPGDVVAISVRGVLRAFQA